MENILFHFAGRPVYVYGSMVAMGLLFATILVLREGKRRGLGSGRMYDFVLWTAVAFFLVGRLAALLPAYGFGLLVRPWYMVTQFDVGIHVPIGLAAAVVYGVYFVVHHGLLIGMFLDAIAPSIVLLHTFAALGSNVYGRPTELPWGIRFGELALHPLPLYYALGYYLMFGVLWRSRKGTRFDGQLFIAYLALSAWLNWFLGGFADPNEVTIHRGLFLAAALLVSGLWFALYTNSPLASGRRRKRSIFLSVSEVVVFVIVVAMLIIGFYARFG